MGIKKIIISTILMLFCSIPTAFSAWTDPILIIQGTWGGSQGQFGIEHQDSGDLFPERIYVGGEDILIIEDLPNGRTKVIDNGKLTKDFSCVESPTGDWNDECNIIGDYLFTNSEGNIWTKDNGQYRLTSPVGEHLATFDQRPLDLGIKRSRGETSNGLYRQEIEYEDGVYLVLTESGISDFTRDRQGFLYGTASVKGVSYPWHYRVYKFDQCGKRIGTLDFPENIIHEHEEGLGVAPVSWVEVEEEYGPPVIGPDGSVYCWKRTPDTYSILKWEWVDDPADPKPGPDTPGNFQVVPSTQGIYVAWDLSPQDPGCVDTYEIERATSADGIYTSLATVQKGEQSYNDASALPGTDYFYRLRAVADDLTSDFTNAMSGKWTSQ
jgi:hypothetical protein